MSMMIQSGRFGDGGGPTPPPLVSATNWRISVLRNAYSEFASVVNTAFAEIEMRLTPGGADQCTGGSQNNSGSLSGFSGNNAFDNNTGTWWVASGTAPWWIQYTHSSPRQIREFALTGRNDEFTGDGPTEFKIQTNDGSLNDFYTFRTGPWGPGEVRVFNVDTFVEQPGRFIRLRPTGVHGGTGNRFSCAKVEFRTSIGGADICTGGVAFSREYQSGNLPANAFDATLSTRYSARISGGFPNNYIGYHLPTAIGQDVVQVALTCRNDTFGPSEAPTGFLVEYGIGNIWTLLWQETGIPGWTAGETKVFTKP